MNVILDLCRKHWQALAPHVKDRQTAKCLIAAVEAGERLYRENNKIEMEARELRLKLQPCDDDDDEAGCDNCKHSGVHPIESPCYDCALIFPTRAGKPQTSKWEPEE
jgi:hypothetical protein